MKTPDEIKKGLEIEIAVHYHLPNPEPRLTPREFMYMEQLHADALAYIERLEQRLAQAERERDAAIHDLWGDCCYCAHNSLTDPRCIERCKRCKHAADAEDRDELGVDRWEWRGVCPENSSDEEHQQA